MWCCEINVLGSNTVKIIQTYCRRYVRKVTIIKIFEKLGKKA